ncbi:hypothetical protein ACWD5F_04805 [Streptomyces sp. NPDC002499]
MSLNVRNFTPTPQTVSVRACPTGGWSARAHGPTRISVRPQGRTTMDFTLTADRGVRRGTDHRLEFTAPLGDGEVPPSVSLIRLR